jgi:GntR family transcriptional repressor for pyruvate dehydrogenase complex
MKKTTSVVEQAARMIKEMLFSGDLQYGDKLPGEVKLAASLGIGRSSVREALHLLAASGYVEIIPNRGAFAAAVCEDDLLSPHIWMDVNHEMVADLLSVRGCIEPFAAELCAKNITEDGLEKMKSQMEAFKDAIRLDDKEQLAQLDLDFHRTILIESHNRYLVQIYEPLLEAFMQYSRQSNASTYAKGNTFDEHYAIYNAIAERSPCEANAAMRLHIAIALRRSENLNRQS